MKFTDDIPKIICVYKITNIVNNLILIGSTTNLCNRINHYRNDINKENPLKHYNRKFLQDIINFGINSFIVDVIEEFSNITNIELKNKESEYIIKYNSINDKIGYNIRLDINGKYICNNSTKLLKSEQLKEQWSKGIRKEHSAKLKKYWENNTKRKLEQSKIMSNNLTKFYYNIYKDNKLIKEKIYYKELEEFGLKSVLKYFADEDKILNKNKPLIKKYCKKVNCKGYVVERFINLNI